MGDKVEGNTQCRPFFKIEEPDYSQLPGGAREMFSQLAERGGDPGGVDSCDLDEFYRREDPARRDRPLYAADFLAEARDKQGYATIGFNYQAFYDFLGQFRDKTAGVRHRLKYLNSKRFISF